MRHRARDAARALLICAPACAAIRTVGDRPCCLYPNLALFQIPDIRRMSTLFSPIELRDLKLSNRIMVSPMCQ